MTLVRGDLINIVLITVDQSGKGDFQRIQDAIDAVPSQNSEQIFVYFNSPGIYKEQVVVPEDKPWITMSGTNETTTIITWSGPWHTLQNTTVSILASDFVGRNLTIQNTYGPGIQAVALSVFGDRVAFYNCRIFSYQDTLFDTSGRHYYSNCFIQGATDFIYGDALSLFHECYIHSISENGGAITAHKRSSVDENTGYSFVSCNITGIKPNSVILGRPWGPYSRIIYAYTSMTNAILPEGWNDWNNTTRQSTSYYGEYMCYGPGATSSKRVKWSHQLTSDEAKPFLTKDMINGDEWLRAVPTQFKKPSFPLKPEK
ncbi:LOW QUALITY PROTEIN: putative pectinesterase 11 [Dioscorea cayenensis subsp. rotundata]|uniref:pectinesterase n=1 Tax=Dioscorea cayennensis subsp. rotundata TaxID=55577 RepID=A0AB40ALQ2_DIOCR|nr:LOW QUALITY PROTEIN: putative pectinesterase 11 [Dioscorea cayenensis subsp. rotundata]